jgi:hypothetical protein
MCFSAGASFAGGVVISAIGVATLIKVHKPSQIVFASIPLFFGFQQFVEGCLWSILQHPQYLAYQSLFTTIFLIMAQVFWPIMIPLAVIYMEKNRKKKRILWILFAVGSTVSIFYIYCLLNFHVTPEISGYHIYYNDEENPKILSFIAFGLYLVTSITPLFVSSVKRTHLLGILMSLSCLITIIFFTQYLTSVWCFFAALISAVIFWILMDSKRKYKFDKLNYNIHRSDFNL